MRVILIALVVCFLSVTSSAATLEQMTETRYCGEPVRDANGNIYRSYAVRSAFKKAHPCPVDGNTTGSCAGWGINHTIPLVCGGCDSVINLSWVPLVLKTGPGFLPIDRWERKIYCFPRELVPMPVGPHTLMLAP